MNIIEQIDDKFRAKAGNEIHPNDVVPLQRYEWQHIKAELAKVRDLQSLEEAVHGFLNHALKDGE